MYVFVFCGDTSKKGLCKTKNRCLPFDKAWDDPGWGEDVFFTSIYRGSLNGTHFGGCQTMQIYGNFEGFPLV